MSGRQPSAWDSSIRSPSQRYLSVDGCRVKYIGPGSEDRDAAAVRANHPVPADCPLYYFEVEVVSRGRDGFIGQPLLPAAERRGLRPAAASSSCCWGAFSQAPRQLWWAISSSSSRPQQGRVVLREAAPAVAAPLQYTQPPRHPPTRPAAACRGRLLHGGGQAGPAAGLGAAELRVGLLQQALHARLRTALHHSLPDVPCQLVAALHPQLRCTHAHIVSRVLYRRVPRRYHGDDGHAFSGRGTGRAYGPQYSTGERPLECSGPLSACGLRAAGQAAPAELRARRGSAAYHGSAPPAGRRAPPHASLPSSSKSSLCAPPAGDWIGVVFNRVERTIAFTKRGYDLGVAFEGVAEERLYPSVGFRTPDEEVGAWVAGALRTGAQQSCGWVCLPVVSQGSCNSAFVLSRRAARWAACATPALALPDPPASPRLPPGRYWPTSGPTWRPAPSRAT